MKMTPKPISQQHMDEARTVAATMRHQGNKTPLIELVAHLVAHADHMADELAKLRVRCPVLAEDVAEAGVTSDHAHWWAQHTAWPSRFDAAWGFNPHDLVDEINSVARDLGVAPLDVLAEMAATEVGE